MFYAVCPYIRRHVRACSNFPGDSIVFGSHKKLNEPRGEAVHGEKKREIEFSMSLDTRIDNLYGKRSRPVMTRARRKKEKTANFFYFFFLTGAKGRTGAHWAGRENSGL